MLTSGLASPVVPEWQPHGMYTGIVGRPEAFRGLRRKTDQKRFNIDGHLGHKWLGLATSDVWLRRCRDH